MTNQGEHAKGDWVPTHAATPRRTGLGVAILTLGILVALVAIAVFMWARGSGDDDPALDDGSLRAESRSVLDDLFPDNNPAADATPMSTPAPLDPARAALALQVVDAASATNDVGAHQVVILIENTDTVAYANVAGVAQILDGPDVAHTVDFVLAAIDPGQVIPVEATTTAPPASVDDIRLDYSARGTVATGFAAVDIADVAWSQNSRGRVSVTGTATSDRVIEFVGIVVLMYDADDAFAGTAVGFLDAATPAGVEFNALGFPATEITRVEVYAAP